MSNLCHDSNSSYRFQAMVIASFAIHLSIHIQLSTFVMNATMDPLKADVASVVV